MIDEYLITNNLGSYCSSTFHKGNTRKYHGLFVTSNDNLERYMVVNRIDESITIDEKVMPFSTNIYKENVIHPEGYKYLKSFEIDPKVKLEYKLENLKITKTIEMERFKNEISVKYFTESISQHILKINPMITFRSFHDLKTYSNDEKLIIQELGGNIEIKFDQGYEMIISGTFDNFYENQIIYKDFEYPVEKERGYNYREDLINIGEFAFNLDKNNNFAEIKFSIFEK